MLNKKNINPAKLSPQEEDLMRAYWKIGKGEISDAISEMENQTLPYTTVASMVKKLETEGYLRRNGKRRGHLYEPSITEKEYTNSALRHLVTNFFTGSYKALVTHFAQEEKLTKEEIEEILTLIEAGDKENDEGNI